VFFLPCDFWFNSASCMSPLFHHFSCFFIPSFIL
jgi:hypothetical protein